jgi:hypothetical protein
VGWEDLFADLEGEFDAAEAAGLAAEIEDRTRRESARLRLVDRLRAATGIPVMVDLPHLGTLRGVVADVGGDWLLLHEARNRQALVPLRRVTGVVGLGDRAEEPDLESPVASRLSLGYALRALARARTPVVATLTDGVTRTGTVNQVGADHLVLVEHELDEVPVPNAIRQVSVIPFDAVVAVRSR